MIRVSTAPHTHSPANTRSIMRDVLLALVPAGIAATIIFGTRALLVMAVSVVGCILFEYIATRLLLHKRSPIGDLSAAVTGLLLAYNLPSSIPLWMVLVGDFVAIVIAKAMFGGLGKNIFNPALVGRVFLLISFPFEMTSWPKPLCHTCVVDAVTAATPLSILGTSGNTAAALTQIPSYLDLFLGNCGGSLGEVSALAILLGLAYLLVRRVISLHIPVAFCLSFLLLTLGGYVCTEGLPSYDPLLQILTGGILLGAVFMATDYATSPMSKSGRILFGVGCGAITFVIRHFGSYPEGVSFAILIMNAFVPIIDNVTRPRIFGTKRRSSL